MSDSEFLDFEKLVAPVQGDAPCGADLRKDYAPDALYRKIKDARQRAGKAERDAWAEETTASADWAEVLNLAPSLLYDQTKDLEVACWLTEALLRKYGYAGLRDGFKACTLLVENFWDNLHPNPDPEEEPDEDEGLIRVAALTGLNGGDYQGTLIAPLSAVDLVDSSEPGKWGLSAFEQAVTLEGITDSEEREKRLEHGAVTLEKFNACGQSTSPAFFEALAQDIEDAKLWFEKLMQAIEQRCPPELCPPSSAILNAMSDCRQRLQAFINEFAPQLAASGTDSGEQDPAGESQAASQTGRTDGPLQSRDQAFALIRQAAEYFRRTEPHSVLSWQLEECVKWGSMSLPDLLKELITDESALDNVYKRVGIPKPKEEDPY